MSNAHCSLSSPQGHRACCAGANAIGRRAVPPRSADLKAGDARLFGSKLSPEATCPTAPSLISVEPS
eukprot:896763-Prymnesium_polylepis.2